MSSTPRICGLMLAYFKAGMTLNCLKTLDEQGIEKIILVDNSNCPEEHQHTLQLTQHFPQGWLEVVIAEDNLGFAKGMNLALDHARQLGVWDYFLILNNDIEAKPTLVQSLCEHMEQHLETGMLSATTETSHLPQAEGYYHRWTGLLFRKPVWGSFLFLGGHCLMIRAKATGKELFNPRYFMYGEDIELNWKLAQQGWKLAVLPEVLLRHEAGSSSNNGSFFYEYHVNRWHLQIVASVGNNRYERLAMYAVRVPLLLARALLRSGRFRSLVPLKALLRSAIASSVRPSGSH